VALIDSPSKLESMKKKDLIPAAPAPKQEEKPTSKTSAMAERGAKLLYELCNTDDPQERHRLARELDAHLMQDE
jgi:hypothetical protein